MIILETVRMYTKHVLNGEQEFTGKKNVPARTNPCWFVFRAE